MKIEMRKIALAALVALPFALNAQQVKVANMRAYDKSGINVFEDPKTEVKFEGLGVRWGAGFTQPVSYTHLDVYKRQL